MRIGYAVAPPPAVALVNRVRLPFNLAGPAQAAAQAALTDQQHLSLTVGTTLMERERLCSALSSFAAPLRRVVPSEANFLLIEFERDANPIYEELLKRAIIVRHFGGGLAGYLRVSIGTPEQNNRFLTALKEVL